MKWFKEIWTDKTQFLIEKRHSKGEYFVDIVFYIGSIQYVSSNEASSSQDMEEEFERLNEDDCLVILRETKTSLN